MEVIQHLFGACADNHAHLDFSDLIYGAGASVGLYQVRYYISALFFIVKSKFKR